MTEEQKQALIEQAKLWIANCEAMRDEIPFGLDSEADNELSLIKIALAAMTAQPVKLPESFYGVIQNGKVVMLPADDGQWLNKTSVAEAFRALERQKEAAEHERDALQAALAEMEKQESKPSYFLNRIESSDKWGPEVELRIYESQLDACKSKDDHGGGIIELFTRPAPAVSLAELVPDECVPAHYTISGEKEGLDHPRYAEGFNACRAAILRNIEEAK